MWGISQTSQILNNKIKSLPVIDTQIVLMIVAVLLIIRIILFKILTNIFKITVPRPQHKINTLEYSYFYHLSIIILILSDINWNAFDLCLWIFSYICIGMIRDSIYVIKIQKQMLLNDYSYEPKIVVLLTSSKIYGLLLFIMSIGYFFLVHFIFMGTSVKMTSLLLFPTLMLATDSLFLSLGSIATSKDILCHYNQNINQIPPSYKLDLIHTIVGNSIGAWHYYNLFRLFFKTFFQKISFFDSMWILSVANAGYISMSTLARSLHKYRSYNKLIQRMNRIFRKNKSTPDQICIICMQQLLNCRRLTRCGHLFHYKCLFQWVQTKYQCPVCRIPININQ